MSIKERESKILEYLRQNRRATVEELCGAFYVSEPTMRRDLANLSREGKIVRTHGGAEHKSELGENLPLSLREQEHSDAKNVIGKKCLELIGDGDVIMTDGSSSALALLRLLDGKKSVIVITNSAKASLILAEANIKTLVTGGELVPDTLVYAGSYAENFIRSFNADICFFSVRTLTKYGALTDNAIAENSIRRAMLSRSKKRVLMLDSQKVGEPCLSTLCTLDNVDLVISERDISEHFPKYREKFI